VALKAVCALLLSHTFMPRDLDSCRIKLELLLLSKRTRIANSRPKLWVSHTSYGGLALFRSQPWCPPRAHRRPGSRPRPKTAPRTPRGPDTEGLCKGAWSARCIAASSTERGGGFEREFRFTVATPALYLGLATAAATGGCLEGVVGAAGLGLDGAGARQPVVVAAVLPHVRRGGLHLRRMRSDRGSAGAEAD